MVSPSTYYPLINSTCNLMADIASLFYKTTEANVKIIIKQES